MQNEGKLGLYQDQVQTYVSFTSFMTGVTVFFTGLLLTSYDDYDLTIRVPIAFLIISIFGFLYATLIYTGTAEEITNEREREFRRSMSLGDTLSEYLGVYLLVLSIPLVVNVISGDPFLKVVAIAASLLGLAIYQASGVSMVKRHFGRGYRAVSVIFLAFGAALFASQLYDAYFSVMATIFILFILVATYVAVRKQRASA